MNRAVSAACAQAFRSPPFYLAAAGTAVVVLVSLFSDLFSACTSPELLSNGSHVALFQTAVSSDVMTLALPILAALPCTAAYLDDMTSGFVKSYLPRTRRRDYIAGRLLSCLLSGGAALALGAVLAFGILTLALLPREAALRAGESATPWLAPLLRASLLLFGSGALWSVVGLAMSAVTGSKYMAYAAPFVLYYVLIILCDRYVPGLVVWDPREWISPKQPWPGGISGIAALIVEQIALWGALFAALAKRRLERL